MDICKYLLRDSVLDDDSFQNYSNKPKIADMRLIAFNLTADSLIIDSENHLSNKLKKEHLNDFTD
jgi:hypothetical protein